MNRKFAQYLLTRPTSHIRIWLWIYSNSVFDTIVISLKSVSDELGYDIKLIFDAIIEAKDHLFVGISEVPAEHESYKISFKQDFTAEEQAPEKMHLTEGLLFNVGEMGQQTPPETHWIQDYIKKNCPRVAKMEKQPSYLQCVKLESSYPKELIQDKLDNMENYRDKTKTIEKKYNTVHLTLDKWCKKEVRDQKKNSDREFDMHKSLSRYADLNQFTSSMNALIENTDVKLGNNRKG